MQTEEVLVASFAFFIRSVGEPVWDDLTTLFFLFFGILWKALACLPSAP